MKAGSTNIPKSDNNTSCENGLNVRDLETHASLGVGDNLKLISVKVSDQSDSLHFETPSWDW